MAATATNLMDQLDDGVHDIEMTIEIDFKFPQEDSSQKSQFKFGGKGPKPTKIREKFVMIYELPNGHEVRTDSLSRTNPRWTDKRTCHVDMDMLLDFYEKPMDFALFRMAQMGAPTGGTFNQSQLKSINDESDANLAGNEMISSNLKNAVKMDTVDRRRELRRQSLQHLQQRLALIARHGRRNLSKFGQIKAPIQPHHYDSAEKMIRASTPRKSGENGEDKEKLYQTSVFVPQSSENTEKAPDMFDLNADLRPKTPPQPHHFDSPEKHAYEHFEEELEKQRPKTNTTNQRPPSATRPTSTSANRPSSANRPKSSNGSGELKKTKIESSSFNIKDASTAQMPTDAKGGKMRSDFLQPVTSIRLDSRLFYWDSLSEEVLCEQHVAGVESITVRVSLNHPLLSRSQHEKLNPMCITISSAENMPDQPLSWSELQQKFKPAYVKVKLFDLLNESTSGLPQSRKLSWNSKHVLLTGTFDQVAFKQQLLNEKLELEIHDRDEITDVAIEEDTTSPCGFSTTSLSDLVLDNKEFVKFALPVLPKQIHIYENQKKISRTPQGQWLQSKTTLKTKIELAYPLMLDDADIEQFLQKATEQFYDQTRGSTPSSRARSAEISALMQRRQLKGGKYARAAIYFTDLELSIFQELFMKITEINMKALGFDFDKELDRELFETYKLSPEERQTVYDIITGCHIFDTHHHWVFFEGLPKNGLQVLIDFIKTIVEQKNLNIKIFAASPDDVRGLFPYRMWAQIESDILHLKLNSDLASILSKGSTYKTTGVSRESYDALQVMLEIITCPDYETFFKKQLVVTSPMIKCLLNKFATRCSFAEILAQLVHRDALKSRRTGVKDCRQDQSNTDRRRFVPKRAPTNNPEYETFLKEFAGRELNFIKLNQCRYPTWCEPMDRSYDNAVFNYSVQTLNTAERIKGEVYTQLANRYPNHLFELNGRTFPIGDYEDRHEEKR